MLSFDDYQGRRNVWEKGIAQKFPVQTIIGFDRENNIPVTHEFNGKTGNLIVHGIPGSGMLNEVNLMLYGLTKLYRYNELHINVMDCRGVGDFDAMSFASDKFDAGFEIHTAKDSRTAYKLLISTLLDVKEKVFKLSLTQTYLLVLNDISKIQAYISDNQWKNMMSTLQEVFTTCTEHGIYIILVDADVKQVFTKKIRESYASRLVLRSHDAIFNLLISDNVEPDFPDKVGYGYYHNGSDINSLILPICTSNIWRA